MIKRPLAAAALGAALVLAGLVLLRPQPYEDYGEIQGKTLTVTGRVYKKETAVNWKGEETPVLYVKLETAGAIGKTASGPDRSGRKADTGPPGEHVICYLKSGQKEPEIGSWAALTGKAAVFESIKSGTVRRIFLLSDFWNLLPPQSGNCFSQVRKIQ